MNFFPGLDELILNQFLFALTDLPCILSGDRLALIDPLQKYSTYQGEAATGHSWRLPQQRAELQSAPHEYAGFTGRFGCTENILLEGQFKGTIFRFPLRQHPSELSETVYTQNKVNSLFSSFEAEAALLLLFLKSVEAVEVWHHRAGQSEPEVVFTVSVEESCRQDARNKRSKFMAAIDPSRWLDEPVRTVYNLDVTHTHSKKSRPDCSDHTPDAIDDGSRDVTMHRYLVAEYYAGGTASETMCTLHQNQALTHIPLVGVAMPIGTKPRTPPVVSEMESTECSQPAGQVFCFLPLRAEQRSDSGLPVHINGYFSVSQNRHYLNLPTAGQDIGSDRGLAWNNCLLTEAIPLAYRNLILAAILCVEKGLYDITAWDVYAAIPQISQVHEQWQVILEPIFRKLFKKAIFYSPGPQPAAAKWIPASEAIFDSTDERPAINRAAATVLRQGGVHVVDCPEYLIQALRAFSKETLHRVKPDLLRKVLKQQPQLLSQIQPEHKLLLLEYILKDEKFHDLRDIALLPLASGQFISFCLPRQVEKVFFVKNETEQALMSRLPEQLLLPDLNDTVSGKLKKLANAGRYSPTPLCGSHLPPNTRKRHPRTNSWGQGVGCLVCVQSLILHYDIMWYILS